MTTHSSTGDTEQERYERNLRKIQREHLEQVYRNTYGYGFAEAGVRRPFQPCMHDQCPQCHGTGIKLDGTSCVHGISCPCPKCTPTC